MTLHPDGTAIARVCQLRCMSGTESRTQSGAGTWSKEEGTLRVVVLGGIFSIGEHTWEIGELIEGPYRLDTDCPVCESGSSCVSCLARWEVMGETVEFRVIVREQKDTG